MYKEIQEYMQTAGTQQAADAQAGGQDLREAAQRKLYKALAASPEGEEQHRIDKSRKRAAQRGAGRAEAALFTHHGDNRRAYRASVRLLLPLLHEGCAIEGASAARDSLLSSDSEDAAALIEMLLALLDQQETIRDSR